MAGYKGYSMSNNAVTAYESGLKPKSKWTKQDFIDYAHTLDDIAKRELIKKARIKELRYLLICAEYHHTSSYFNCTDFYTINDDFIVNCTIDELIERLKPIEEEAPKEYKARCKFLEWSGSKKHPKATEVIEIGTIKGNWFIRSDGSKKSITANGFKILEKQWLF